MKKVDIEAVERRIKDWTDKTKGEGEVDPSENWGKMADEGFLRVYCLCAFSSRTRYKTVRAFVEKLEREALFDYQRFASKGEHEREIYAVLSTRLPGVGGLRLNKRRSEWLARMALNIRESRFSFEKVLRKYASDDKSAEQPLRLARQARKHLGAEVVGFRLKQSSMFLRKVGYYSDFAILDTHVMNYLKAKGRVSSEDVKMAEDGWLGDLEFYERIEPKFQELARELGFPVKCADQAVWMELSGTADDD